VFCGTTLVGLHLAHKKKDKVNLFAPFLWMAGYNTIKTYKKESHGVAPQDISADRFSNEAEELNWYDRHHGNEDYDDFEYEREIDSRDIHEADEDFQRFFERSWKDDDSDDFEVDNDLMILKILSAVRQERFDQIINVEQFERSFLNNPLTCKCGQHFNLIFQFMVLLIQQILLGKEFVVF